MDKYEVQSTRYKVRDKKYEVQSKLQKNMQDFKQRTFQFAVSVAKLIQALPYNLINKTYGGQLIRCSSSVGANYRAARRAKSNPDVLNKFKIAEEECDESIYFLELF